MCLWAEVHSRDRKYATVCRMSRLYVTVGIKARGAAGLPVPKRVIIDDISHLHPFRHRSDHLHGGV